ncbi:MAG: DUF2721 domain-containing protein [Planctomycetota bacterium]
MPEPGVIQQLIAPAAMIPACGLLLLSSTARTNTVLARIRAFHAERLAVWRDEHEPGTRAEAVRTLRLEGLELQTHRLLARAALLRVTMLQLFGGVVCNAATMLLLAIRAADVGLDGLYTAAVVVFVLGVLFLLGSMVTSVLEVWRILETVRYEHGRVESLCGVEPAAAPSATLPTAVGPAMGEGTGL